MKDLTSKLLFVFLLAAAGGLGLQVLRLTQDPLSTSLSALSLLAASCGALGATLHALGSLVAFVGNGRFHPRWALWYLAQPVRGALLAAGFYWAWTGNLLPGGNGTQTAPLAAPGLMFMVGLFSDPAIEKLREVFLVLFRTGGKRRADPLEDGRQPVIARLGTSSLDGIARLEIEGSDFAPGDEVTVDGAAVPVLTQTATQLVAQLPAVPAAGTRLVVSVTPVDKGASPSAPASVLAR